MAEGYEKLGIHERYARAVADRFARLATDLELPEDLHVRTVVRGGGEFASPYVEVKIGRIEDAQLHQVIMHIPITITRLVVYDELAPWSDEHVEKLRHFSRDRKSSGE